MKFILYFVVLIINTELSLCNKIHNIFFYTESELQQLFNSRLCITENEIPEIESEESSSTDVRSPPLSKIHELATYNKVILHIRFLQANKIKRFLFKGYCGSTPPMAFASDIDYRFFVISEEGPAHNKWYTVALELGNPEWDIHSEEFTGFGSKIKDAKKDAAKKALMQTSFVQKPEEETFDLNDNDCNDNSEMPSCRLSFLVKEMNNSIIYKKYNPSARDMYGVQLFLDYQIFKGEDFTVSAAKEIAATKALMYLSNEGDDICNADEEPDNDEDIECTALKSPVTLVYEIAQRYKYPIKYTVAKEDGPPHKRTFTLLCTMGDYDTIGEGLSKKLAKVKASEKMLEILSKLDIPLTVKKSEKISKSRKKQDKIEKLYTDENTETNPIKVLYEWAAKNANGEEPLFVYEDVADAEGPYKKFKAECNFKGMTSIGLGHKKKIAKQNAALDMLHLLNIPHSDEIQRKDSLIDRSYIPGILKAPDYLVRAGISPENEEYESRSSRLAKLNAKLKRAAEFFDSKENTHENIPDSVIEDIIEKGKSNPTKQLEYLLNEIKVKYQYMNLPENKNATFSSLVWLFTKPELLCYGHPGVTTTEAQENSALAVLKFLSELTLAENNSTTIDSEATNK